MRDRNLLLLWLCLTFVLSSPIPCLGEHETEDEAKRAGELEKKFRETIAPVLVSRCLACHGGDKSEGGYSVQTLKSLFAAGDSELPAITRGKLAGSELWRRLTTQDESERMPPESDPLSAATLTSIQQWIEAGAPTNLEDRDRPLTEIAVSSQIRAPDRYPRELAINAIEIVSGGKEVLVGGYAEVTRWEIVSGKLLDRMATTGVNVAAMSLSVDQQTLAVSSGVAGLRGGVELISLWSPSHEKLTVSVTADIAPDLAFSPDAGRLVIACHDGSVRILKLPPERNAIESSISLTPHADAVLAIAWSNRGDQFATASRDRTAKLFDATKNELVTSYDRHERAVGGVGFAGARPVTLDETGRMRVMVGDDSDRVLAEMPGLPRHLQHFKTNGRQLFVPVRNSIRRFDVRQEKVSDGKDDSGKAKQKEVTRIVELMPFSAAPTEWITSLAVREQMLAAGTQQGRVIIWDRETGELQHNFLAKP
jgi:hypothetical protein